MTDPWYAASPAPELLEFDAVTVLNVTGAGEPGGVDYVDSVRALYEVAGRLGVPVPPLEGRWWVEDDRPPFEVPRSEWHWHLFLRMPDTLSPAQVAAASATAAAPAAARLTLASLHEGSCVQVLHEGAFADEPRTLSEMDKFMTSTGLVHNGLHHEIYLTDPQHTPPAQARTILRQPVRAS